MNISCPECRSVFRVDPAKVPPITVRARCSVCGGVITVTAGASIEDEFSSNSSASSSVRATGVVEKVGAVRSNSSLATALLDTLAPPPAIPRTPTPLPNAAPVAPPDRNRHQSVESPSARPVSPSPAANAPATPRPSVPGNAPPPNQRPVLFPPRPMMPGAAPAAGAPSRPIVAPRPAAPTSGAVAPAQPAPAPRQSEGFAQPAATSTSSHAGEVPARAAAPASVPPRPSVPTPSAAPAPTSTRTPINPFLANDPHAKARRLARALVSDLVTYFPQKRQDGLRDGTLKQLFKDEIQKSYEEYVAQVGREFAESTPHFQEALNDLLAGGQKVF